MGIYWDKFTKVFLSLAPHMQTYRYIRGHLLYLKPNSRFSYKTSGCFFECDTPVCIEDETP